MRMFNNKWMLKILFIRQQIWYILRSHDRVEGVGSMGSYTVVYQCLIHHSIGGNHRDWAEPLYQIVYNSRMYFSFQLLKLTLRMLKQNQRRLINRIITGLVQGKKRLCEMWDKFKRLNPSHKLCILVLNNSRH